MKYRILSALALACVSTSAMATLVTGNDLHEFMEAAKRMEVNTQSGHDVAMAFKGMGYVEGIADAHERKSICLPTGTEVQQLMAIVSRYVDAHPEQWQYTADSIIEQALSQSFPCKGR
jgi:NifU-like protein involved in Fe-S cluster formation